MNRKGRARRAGDGARPDAPVARITTVPTSLAEDVGRRMRRYLIQMSIRAVCLVGAVVVQHWTRWLLLVAAVVLPYIAVLLANAGRVRQPDPGTFLGPTAILGPQDGPAPEPPTRGPR